MAARSSSSSDPSLSKANPALMSEVGDAAGRGSGDARGLSPAGRLVAYDKLDEAARDRTRASRSRTSPISVAKMNAALGLGVTRAMTDDRVRLPTAAVCCSASRRPARSPAGLASAPGRPRRTPMSRRAAPARETADRQPFYGRHQAGIVTPRPAAGLVAAFRGDRRGPGELERLFRTLTERAAFLTQGGAPPELDPRFPPADSGILGPVVTPDNLTMTVSVGASLFDERYGLAARKPVRLSRMTRFPNDALEAARCHGDLSIQLCANTPDTSDPRPARRGEEPARPSGPALDPGGLRAGAARRPGQAAGERPQLPGLPRRLGQSGRRRTRR